MMVNNPLIRLAISWGGVGIGGVFRPLDFHDVTKDIFFDLPLEASSEILMERPPRKKKSPKKTWCLPYMVSKDSSIRFIPIGFQKG